MISIDENTLTGIVRAEVSFARDRGLPVKRYLTVALAVADLLELPDDTRFIPATAAALETPTRLDTRYRTGSGISTAAHTVRSRLEGSSCAGCGKSRTPTLMGAGASMVDHGRCTSELGA
jgi:hypothetical protein